ncbi:hypothetical protein AGMMS49975_16950 [Clostridia bacterium]|nr:hypothetical protein AGMMS49975_16950 [Clostridia bacterium]GHU74467.1 hypothetical protein FACS1894188_02770 [Clostridia bacterium]
MTRNETLLFLYSLEAVLDDTDTEKANKKALEVIRRTISQSETRTKED